MKDFNQALEIISDWKAKEAFENGGIENEKNIVKVLSKIYEIPEEEINNKFAILVDDKFSKLYTPPTVSPIKMDKLT